MPTQSSELSACPLGKLKPLAVVMGSGKAGRERSTSSLSTTPRTPPIAIVTSAQMASRLAPRHHSHPATMITSPRKTKGSSATLPAWSRSTTVG